VFRIELPSLRERREDIPLLADSFMKKFAQAMNKKIAHITPEAMNALQQYDWPGNVRELENSVERAMVVAREPELRLGDFSLRLNTPLPSQGDGSARSLEDIERSHILRVLEECGNNQTRAADVLNIDRVTLHNKLKKYGWSRPTVEVR
jgi:two-component system response regulator HydG